MSIGIIVDSGCDLRELPEGLRDSVAFKRVALTLRVGEEEFTDDVSLDIDDFLYKMKAYDGATGSAAPSPGQWADAFDEADEIFAITITSSLSATYSSAETGKHMVLEEEHGKKIHVIDSLSAGPEISLIVLKIAELAASGKKFEQIAIAIEEYRRKTHLVFVLASLDNLVKNGRASRVEGQIAGLLHIKLLGCASEKGTLEVIHKLRGKRQAYDSMINEMSKRGYMGGKIIISHCHNEEKANYIIEKLKEKYPEMEAIVMPASGLCSYYIEEGGVLLGYES